MSITSRPCSRPAPTTPPSPAAPPARVLKNKMAREYLRMEKKDVPLEEMEQLTLGSLRKAVFDGDVDGGSFMAGQVAGMVHEIRPLRQIFEELMAGYAAVRKGLSE